MSTIRSERLDLVLLDAELLAASLAGRLDWVEQRLGARLPEGWPDCPDVFQMRLAQIEADPGVALWLMRALVMRKSGIVVGHLGGHTAPGPEYLAEYAADGVEFGFTIFPPYRRQGLAREAGNAWMRWAAERHGVNRFVLSIRPDNLASQAVARGWGFRRIGSHQDEQDGEEDVLLLDRAGAGHRLADPEVLSKLPAVQRLGLNQGRYFGEGIDIEAVLARGSVAAERTGWTLERFSLPELAVHPLAEVLAFHRRPAGARRRIYLSTGIHGDEPAGPLAVERLLVENQWPDDAEVTVCPCLNRSGFPQNTRENAEGIDLNRDYRNPVTAEVRNHVAWLERQAAFDLTLCLHEDWEAHGFYLYELNPDARPSLADAIVAAAGGVCPIDASAEIDGRPTAAPGIIRPDLDPATRPAWAEALYLIQSKTRQSYTLEAPSDWPLVLRVEALVRATRAAMGPA